MSIEAFQAVVADNHTPIEIVQIGRCKPAAFEGHQRTQFRRNHRDDVEHHPFRLVQRRPFAFAEGLNHAQAFQGFLLLLHRGFFRDLRTEFGRKGFNIDLLQQVLDRLATNLRHEAALVGRLKVIVVLGSDPRISKNCSSEIRSLRWSPVSPGFTTT